MSKQSVRFLVTCLVALTVMAGSALAQHREPGQAVPPGAAVIARLRIGLDGNPKTSSNYTRADWADSIQLMRTTGANHFHYAKLWTEIEAQAGVYTLDEVQFMMAQTAPLPVAFNLRVVDAGARNMPETYKTLAWDSPDMIAHVTQAIQQLAPILGSRPWSYAIGNEIDSYFGTHQGEIAAYARMLAAVKAQIRTRHPGARFTTSFQFLAAGQLQSLYAPIVAQLDHVAFTYYPLGADFSVRPASSAAADLQFMMTAAQPRPIYLQEVGYPASALLGSSPDQQRAFVQAIFEAIRAAGPTRVYGATYLFQSDLPDWVVSAIVQAYGNNSDRFRAYLTTLGLRDEKDNPRPGWDEFVRQAGLITPTP
jgi:hypothetical protein